MTSAYMQFYPADYLADTMHLTLEEHGAYIKLLFCMWRADGSLPNNDKKICQILGTTPKKWVAIKQNIGAFFVWDGDLVTSPKIQQWKLWAIRQDKRRGLPLLTRNTVLERDGRQCVYCGEREKPFHIDHIHPVYLGGTDEIDNLVVACEPCNLSKGKKTVQEWLQ